MNEISQEKPRLADVGAGFGELFINRAKTEPEKSFIIIEPLGFPDLPTQEMPKNLTWIKGRLTDKEALPFQNGSVDEVNLNFSLSTMYADYQGPDQELGGYLQKILREAFRVLKDGGRLVVREERGFCQDVLRLSLDELGADFRMTPAQKEDLSLTGQEMWADHNLDREKNQRFQPMEVVITKIANPDTVEA